MHSGTMMKKHGMKVNYVAAQTLIDVYALSSSIGISYPINPFYLKTLEMLRIKRHRYALRIQNPKSVFN